MEYESVYGAFPAGGPESPGMDADIEDMEICPDAPYEKLNHEKNCSEAHLVDWEQLMAMSEFLDSIKLEGRGPGKNIVGTMAAVLDTNDVYDFTVEFKRLPDDEELPEGW